MFSKKATNFLPSIWRYVVNFKMKISSIFVAFLENINYTLLLFFIVSVEMRRQNYIPWNLFLRIAKFVNPK